MCGFRAKRAAGPAFDLCCITDSVGVPSFALLGWRRAGTRRHTQHGFCRRTRGCAGSIATRLAKNARTGPPCFGTGKEKHKGWASRPVGCGARLSPSLRCGNHPRAPDSTPHSAALPIDAIHPTDKNRLVPAIRGGRRLLGIPVGRVASMCLFERLRQRLWSLRHRDRVRVIRHEAVAQPGESEKLRMVGYCRNDSIPSN